MAFPFVRRAKEASPTASESSEGNESGTSDNEEGNSVWANSILKALQPSKAKTQKTVPTRTKKNYDTTNGSNNKGKQNDYDFEIDGSDEKKPKKENDVKPETSALDAELTRQQRKNMPLQLRVKPSFRDMERERNLRKVATRGTVQFFNAVRIQQKDLKQQLAEAGTLDSRQDAVLNNIDKRKFLDVLMSGKRAKSSAIDNSVKKEESETEEEDDDEDESTDDEQPANSGNKKKSEWNVLREDFMTNKKIKHWDEEDEEQEQEQEEGQGTSEDSDE